MEFKGGAYIDYVGMMEELGSRVLLKLQSEYLRTLAVNQISVLWWRPECYQFMLCFRGRPMRDSRRFTWSGDAQGVGVWRMLLLAAVWLLES